MVEKMDTDCKDTISQLPRGLISRRGAHERLPGLSGLRSDSRSPQSLITSNAASNPLSTTTRGGVIKRTFKPTIPIRRNVNEDIERQSQLSDNKSQNRRSKQPNSRNTRSKDTKNWIQTEGAVFRGEQNINLRSSAAKDQSITRKRFSVENENQLKTERCDEKIPKTKIESKAKLIRKLYGNNFIDDDNEEVVDNQGEYPKGWQSVCSHRQPSVPSGAEPLTAYNLLKTESQEKVLLMQIPEEFLRRPNGYVGKMRVFKSGRIELQDSESDIKFEIIFDKISSLDKNVKQENDGKCLPQTTCDDITEEVVYLSGSDLSTLATIEHKQVLLAVPTIPLEDQITPHVNL